MVSTVFSKHKWKIIPVLVGPSLAFSVWAADAFIQQVVQDKIQVLDSRLSAIEKELAAIDQHLKDIKELHR